MKIMPTYSIDFIAKTTGLSVEFLSKCPLNQVIELGELAADSIRKATALRQRIIMIQVKNKEK
jgi:hypothetical protein